MLMKPDLFLPLPPRKGSKRVGYTRLLFLLVASGCELIDRKLMMAVEFAVE